MSTREQWLNDFMNAARPIFADLAGAPIPEKVRLSVGFPSTGSRGKRIGECWSDLASKDGFFEIFVTPAIDDTGRIADIVTHELVHAAAGLKAGHGAGFRRVAVKIGLEGKMTSTTAGAAWHAWADPILADLGPIPHATLRGQSSGPKKQTTRMIKCTCDTCGYTYRAARKWVEGFALVCPDLNCKGSIDADLPADEDEDEDGGED